MERKTSYNHKFCLNKVRKKELKKGRRLRSTCRRRGGSGLYSVMVTRLKLDFEVKTLLAALCTFFVMGKKC